MHDLGMLPGGVNKPGNGSQASSVNRQGLVVGSSLNSMGESRAVIWENGKIVDLNTLIPPTPGVVLTRAMAINNRGQIVAQQQVRADGLARSFLLTPRVLRH
jgi:probable HAF family extracellular repeat protein